MAKEFKAPMVQDYRTEIAVVTAATTDRTGATTTNLVKLCDTGEVGSKLTAIHFKGQGDSAASTGLIFIRKAEGDYLLFDEVTLEARSATNSVESQQNRALYEDLPLQSGIEIFVGVTALSTTDAWNVFGIISDYKNIV